jgi:hypothetical protein
MEVILINLGMTLEAGPFHFLDPPKTFVVPEKYEKTDLISTNPVTKTNQIGYSFYLISCHPDYWSSYNKTILKFNNLNLKSLVASRLLKSMDYPEKNENK